MAKPCEEWTGYRNRAGYGSIYLGRQPDGKPIRILAHRLSWMRNYKEIPDGMEICHTCDNPSCVEITHLFMGTKKDNMEDMVSKGRQVKGLRQHKAKLSDADVSGIRWFRAAGVSNRQVARLYKISPAHVSGITAGRDRPTLKVKVT